MQIRDLVLRQQARFETKTDKQIFRRAVLTTEGGLQTSSDPPNDVWASRNERRVWYMADGATQPAQILCRKISNPYVGLGVIIGYADGSNAKEVLTTDFFLTGAGTNLDGWDDTGPEDLEPGGNKLLWVYTKVITPLATYPDPTGLAVNIIAGDYPYAGARKSFAGSLSFALTQNPNPGEHYYAGLYLDSSNTLQVVYGTSVSTTLTAPEPSWPASAFRLSVVLIDDVQTSIDFDTDIFDRRMAWSDELAGGGWPFAHILTVSATDPDADYSTIAAAIAGASTNDLILVDAGTFNETLTLNKNVTLRGAGQKRTIIDSTSDVTLTIATSGATVEDVGVYNHSSSATTVTPVKTNQNGVTLRRVIVSKYGANSTIAAGVWNAGASDLILDNVTVAASPTGTSSYGLYSDVNSGTNIIQGSIQGDTYDLFGSNASAFVYLFLPILYTPSASWAGTMRGLYTNSSGELLFANTTGTSGGVWRYRADNLRVKEADLSTAYTNASAGDEIHLFPGTYTINALAINKAIAIIGADPLTTIIEGTTNNSYPLKATADNVRLENLTIKQTGGGGGGTNGFGLYLGANGVIAKNCIIQATGATAANYAVYHDAGTTGNCKLINCDLTATGGSAGNYGYVQATVATLMEIWGGSITAATNEVYGSNASAKVWLFNPELASSNAISWAGTLYGRWLNASGVQYSPESNDTFSPITFRPGYIIATSVASNNLTVALKTLDSNDASAANPIVVRIGNTVGVITAALSVTANAGTNWGALGAATTATLENDLFVYLINETGASAGVKIGFSRIPYAQTMGDFTNTTTSQFYIKGNWTNFNATDSVENIGRFNAILSATAAFNWSLPGTSIIINRPIYDTRRLSFTSAVASLTGTITTVGTVTSSYLLENRTFKIYQSITITTNGTGATAVTSTIPLTPGGILTVMPGREIAAGKELQIYVQSTTTATWLNYDNSYPGATGATLTCGGVSIPIA